MKYQVMAMSKLLLWYFNYFSILEFVDGSELVSRCKDKSQAMMGMGDMLNITRTTVYLEMLVQYILETF